MKALIFENKVVDVQETEFEVAPTMTWIDCDNTVKIGFSYDGTIFKSDEPTVEEIAQHKSEQTDAETKKASGKQKLLDLGLSEEEVKALIGV